jgi:hypothetical protein
MNNQSVKEEIKYKIRKYLASEIKTQHMKIYEMQ